MKFLKSKFFNQNNTLGTFLESGNCLKRLEKSDQISESVKRQFAETFVKNLIDSNVISTETINSVDDQNAWSIDFPGWHGEFDETLGKRIFVIGAEPHIYNKYLQTVYGLNNEKSIDELIENGQFLTLIATGDHVITCQILGRELVIIGVGVQGIGLAGVIRAQVYGIRADTDLEISKSLGPNGHLRVVHLIGAYEKLR